MADVDKVTVVSSLDIHKKSVVSNVLNVFLIKMRISSPPKTVLSGEFHALLLV